MLDPVQTHIVGSNGSGKTNLLEAIYLLFHGSSFRASDGDLLQYDHDWWRIEATVDGDKRLLKYQSQKLPHKQLVKNDVTKRFLYTDRLPAVLFEPGDLQMIGGSPNRRRDTFDVMLTNLVPSYKQTLLRYQRALKQRANALKQFNQSGANDSLFVWDVTLSEYGAKLINWRQEFVERLNPYLAQYYQEIASKSEWLEVTYTSPFSGPSAQTQLVHALNKRHTQDIARQTTSIGPHRDEYVFTLNSKDARANASRGEVRSIVLALKLAYAHLLEETFQTAPVMLLDDVFSELDEDRQAALAAMTRQYQSIYTDTHRSPSWEKKHPHIIRL